MCQDLQAGEASKPRHPLPTNEALLEEASNNVVGCVDNFVANGKAFVDPLRIIVVDGTMVGGPTSSKVGVVDKVGGTLSARRMGKDCHLRGKGLSLLGIQLSAWSYTKEGREDFWEELGAIKGLWSDPWFSKVIEDLELKDLSLLRGLLLRARCALPKLVFDYAPIILDRGGVKKGTTPFRFKIMWLKEKGFKDLLKSCSKKQWLWNRWPSGILRIEKADIKERVVQAFQLLLFDSGDWRSSIDGLLFESLRVQEAARLEEPF
ncbi:hypothetical protein CK203_114465 [Vitis vinifera]|uniref:Uncharacterized protein n=1 Tax=Vitis vinifera TaxID=29760 RepID=A0A438BNS8_VITVI|nr:hypothetical protein CK203_114465 [Vitis vinifera]